MKICKYCGSEVPDNAAFCPSCGKRVNADPAQQNGRRYEDVHDVPKRSWGALSSVAGIALALLLCVVVFFAFIKPKVMDRLGIEIKGPSTETEEQSKDDAEADAGDETGQATTKSEFPKSMYVSSEDGLMLRKGPGPENEVLGTLAYGQEIKVEKLEKGWAYTTVDENSGWCSAEYLTEKKSDIKKKEETSTEESNQITQPSNVAEQGHTGRVTAEDGVNVRTGPGTQYDIIDGLPYNAEAIERGWQDGWVYIEYNGKFGWISTEYFTMAYGREKPAIYLYPTEKTDVNVRVKLKTGEFTKTIPESPKGEWTVSASPDGIITDKSNGKEYDYIFWESTDDTKYDWSEGYVVAGYEAEAFLSTILPKMGLNEKETRQFKEYWLPRLGRNKLNLVTFQTERYTDSAALDVSPKPDSVLRVFMVFKEIDEPIRIRAPKIKPFDRKGFAVVEWGGAESVK